MLNYEIHNPVHGAEVKAFNGESDKYGHIHVLNMYFY